MIVKEIPNEIKLFQVKLNQTYY